MLDVLAKILQLSVNEAMEGVSCQMPPLREIFTGLNVPPAWIGETSSVSNDLGRNSSTVCCRFSQPREPGPEFLLFRNLSSLQDIRLNSTTVRRW